MRNMFGAWVSGGAVHQNLIQDRDKCVTAHLLSSGWGVFPWSYHSGHNPRTDVVPRQRDGAMAPRPMLASQ